MLGHLNLEIPRGNKGAMLAWDLATRAGWAAQYRDGTIKSGIYTFDARGHHDGDRFARFRHALITFMDGQKPATDVGQKLEGPLVGRVIYESVEFKADNDWHAIQLYGGWKAILLSWCWVHRIPVTPVLPKDLKHFITGDYHASKDDMVFAMRACGFEPDDHNEADALALLLYGLGIEQGVIKAAA